MVLGNKKIKEHNLIEPYKEENCSPASYDLTVGEIDNVDNILKPGESCLISTQEKVMLPDNIAAFCRTRSSLARIGISAGDIGGWIDPGYKGNLTLLVANFGKRDFDLDTLDRFTQIIFLDVDSADKLYEGKYQNSDGLMTSYIEREGNNG